ncbi:MAG: MFS transporter [Alphaproteobacteria bacterium]
MNFLKHIKHNLNPHDLTERKVKKSLFWVLQDGIFAQMFESLIAGPVLIAVALILGASNLMIGYLMALPSLANLAQFVGAWLVEKYGTRKKIVVYISGIGRLCILGVAFLAFIPQTPLAAYWLCFCYTMRYVGSCLAGAPWNSWMKDLIAPQILGKFFAKRLIFITSTSLLTSLFLVFFFNISALPKNELYGIVFVVAFIVALYTIFVYYKIGEPIMEKPPSSEGFFKKLIKVFKDTNFARLILFISFWNFAINLAVPFFTVMLLKTLHMDMSFVLILTTITSVMSISVMQSWGKISDTYSNKSILQVAAPLYVLCIFLFIFVENPAKHMYVIPLLIFIYALMGIAQAGVTLASNNIALKLAPKGNASIYLSTNSVINALTAGTAPLLGGMFADFFENKSLALLLRWEEQSKLKEFFIIRLSHWDFFFICAAIFGMLSLILLKRVKEEGEVNEKIIVSQFLSLFYHNLTHIAVAPQRLFLFLSRRQYQDKLRAQKEELEMQEQSHFSVR